MGRTYHFPMLMHFLLCIRVQSPLCSRISSHPLNTVAIEGNDE